MMESRISVLIADDHPLFRQGIKQILELENDITVVPGAQARCDPNGHQYARFQWFTGNKGNQG